MPQVDSFNYLLAAVTQKGLRNAMGINMREQLFNYFTESTSTLTTSQILHNFSFAVILGGIIYISYYFFNSRLVYSKRFNITVFMIAVITSLITSIIGNNIALSLGMVGALSIIRFRTPIKDIRDSAYILWSFSAGICSGISDYLVGGIGTAFIFILLLIVNNVEENEKYMLVIKGKREREADIEKTVKKCLKGNAVLLQSKSNEDAVELIFQFSQNILKYCKTSKSKITDCLWEIKDIQTIQIFNQTNEMNQ